MSVADQAALGPCGWPYVVVADGTPVTLAGHSLWDLLPKSEAIGTVELSEAPRAVRAYKVEIDGTHIRFAADEVSNNVWIVSSNDAELVAQSDATTTETNQ